MTTEAIHIHKENTFGAGMAIQKRAAACKAWLARTVREQTAAAAAEAPRRLLGLR